MTRTLHVMLTKVGTKALLSSKEYIFEPKLDGVRALCYINSQATFMSRNNLDLTHAYPELKVRKYIKAKSAVLDGEIVAYDSTGNPSFALLRKGSQAQYAVFDILEYNDKLLIDMPILERKKILERVVTESDYTTIVPHTTDGKKLWREIVKHKLEGVMAKHIDSLYHPGKRTRDWLKIKVHNTIDCVIVGYLTKKRTIASLAVAVYEKNTLRYIGMVGTGYTEQSITQLYRLLRPLHVVESPVGNPKAAPRLLQWVSPKLVCEVQYMVFTQYKILRISSFLRLRADKKPKQCTLQDQI